MRNLELKKQMSAVKYWMMEMIKCSVNLRTDQ